MNSLTLRTKKVTKDELVARLNGLLLKIKELEKDNIEQSRLINDLSIKIRDQTNIIENQSKIIKSMPLAIKDTDSTSYTVITLPSKVRT